MIFSELVIVKRGLKEKISIPRKNSLLTDRISNDLESKHTKDGENESNNRRKTVSGKGL